MLSISWLFFVTLCNFLTLFFYEKGIPHDPSGELSELEKIVQGFRFQLALQVYLAFGMVLCAFMLLFVLQICIPDDTMRRRRVLRAITLPYSFRIAADTKQACTRKLNRVLTNAIDLHFQEWNGVSVNAAESFVLEPRKTTRIGGLLWTWRNLLNRKLSNTYGIWLQSRLAIAQECQIISLLFAIVLLVWGGRTLADDADRKREELEEEPDGALKDEALRFVPEGWMVMATFVFGGFFAVAVSVVLILVYLPTTVATILALRTGKIPNAYDDPNDFKKYRKSADKIFYNVANQIYVS